MSNVLRLEGGGQVVDLYSWLNPKARGVEALAGILGFGMAPVSPRWFEGAGAGSSWRGSRILSRPIDIPLWVYAEDRSGLLEQLSALSIALDPNEGAARLFFGLPDNEEWWVDVVREGGGDWARKVDSDDRTYFKTNFSLRSGDPFWTRTRPEDFSIKIQAEGGKGLLPGLAKLELSSSSVFGTVEVENVGDAPAWPVWTVKGPGTLVTLVGASGESVVWEGVLSETDILTIDMRHSTIVDQDGTNRYDGFETPKFWSIKRGKSFVTAELRDATPDSLLVAQWNPRRQAVV